MDFFIDGKAPNFIDWLLERYDTTPLTLLYLCKQTGKRKDYDKVMAWYRKRYRYEMQLRESLLEANPFQNLEEKKND